MEEKQIEEMAKDMCEYYYEGTCYQDKKTCDCKCDIFTDAQYLYAKGYRKASDVAREIFEEINSSLVYIEEQLDEVPDCLVSVKEDIEYLEKKYAEGKSD